jgi:hypothetical protein
VVSPTTIVEGAEKVGPIIVNTYLEQSKTFPESRDMVDSGALDPL